MARSYNIDKPYNEPDMLYNGLYTHEGYSAKYSEQSTTYTPVHETKDTTYTDKYEDQEFYEENE